MEITSCRFFVDVVCGSKGYYRGIDPTTTTSSAIRITRVLPRFNEMKLQLEIAISRKQVQQK
jgi:hypothetical protein